MRGTAIEHGKEMNSQTKRALNRKLPYLITIISIALTIKIILFSGVLKHTKSVNYPQFFWADRYIHRSHEGVIMVGAGRIFQKLIYSNKTFVWL